MIMMSVDYGDVRTGVAFCDKSEVLASPYGVIHESYQPKLVQKLAKIAAEKGAQKIIVGLPVNMDGSYGFRCDACRELGKMLQETSGIEVDYQDERLTTVIAHDFLSANNVKGKKRKEKVDAVSAVLILQSYIDKNK
ncbi:MAG TPA: Holliday junction resolvase RuvX [Candidatus Eubacterium faecale]|uniref:Putative pre-16S rRNA nuclease n=1 Tax=Candidatus Eubacterium faecale TaxID=2838568 RepID=A0A9D2S984_9FIRM|nr:Holliday junction resolvase RuvX [Candidatus Eubacterium faecale]